jgi:acetoin utilization protein AcuB
MTRQPVTIKPRDTLLRARQLVARREINQLPVVKDKKLVGILTDRDIRDAYPPSVAMYTGTSIDRYARSHFVEEAMTYNLITIAPNARVREAAILLRRNRIGALPVVIGEKLAGIFTRSDLIRALIESEKAFSPDSSDIDTPARTETRERRSVRRKAVKR